MADVLTDLAAYLDANTSLTAGTDLFAGDMPNSPDAVTALYESPGRAPVETMGAPGLPPVILPRVQVQARGSRGVGGYDVARARIRLVYDTLTLLTNTTVNGVYYLRVMPLQEPFFLNRDDVERVVFALNFEVYREHE